MAAAGSNAGRFADADAKDPAAELILLIVW
jgi:hypothetical protein